MTMIQKYNNKSKTKWLKIKRIKMLQSPGLKLIQALHISMRHCKTESYRKQQLQVIVVKGLFTNCSTVRCA